MSDFVDARAGIAAARRARAEMHESALRAAREFEAAQDSQSASVVRRQVTELLDILDDRIERRLQGAKTIEAAPGHHGGGYGRRAARAAGRFLIRLGQVGHQQTAHGVDPDVERIEALLYLPNSLGIARHSSSRAVCVADDATHASTDAHRLSGDGK